jgi:hypothetical protein
MRIEAQEKQTGLSRRDATYFPLVQVLKDFERDKYLVDGVLMTHVAHVLNYLVARVLAVEGNFDHQDKMRDFCQDLWEDQNREEAIGRQRQRQALKHDRIKTMRLEDQDEHHEDDKDEDKDDSTKPQTHPMEIGSPASRIAQCSEAKALAFVERVLRGSSRTQSGGDIYDAISTMCSHTLLTFCPLQSQDAGPVTIETIDLRRATRIPDPDYPDDHIMASTFDHCVAPHPERAHGHVKTSKRLVIYVHVAMDFKAVRMHDTANDHAHDDKECNPGLRGGASNGPPRDHHGIVEEWAKIRGSLTREFTYGAESEPGSIVLRALVA